MSTSPVKWDDPITYLPSLILASSDQLITEYQKNREAKAELFPSIPYPAALRTADALLVADYTRSDEILGNRGDMTVAQLAKVVPYVTMVGLAGCIDIQGLREQSIPVYPDAELGPHRML